MVRVNILAAEAKDDLFCREYIQDFNGHAAALRAGLTTSKRAARQRAYEMLQREDIQQRIRDLIEERKRRIQVTEDGIVEQLRRLGYSNMRDYVRLTDDGVPYHDFSALTEEQWSAITELQVEEFRDGRGDDARDVRRIKFKLAEKRGPLVDLGKHIGMWPSRVEHSGPGGGPIQTEDLSGLKPEERSARIAELLAKRDAADGAGGG